MLVVRKRTHPIVRVPLELPCLMVEAKHPQSLVEWRAPPE